MLLHNFFLFITFVSQCVSSDVEYVITPPMAAFLIHPSSKISNNKKTSAFLQQDFHVIDPFSELQIGAHMGPLVAQKRMLLMADANTLDNTTSPINLARLLRSSVHFVSYNIYTKEPVVRFLVHVEPDSSAPEGSFCFHMFAKYGAGNHATTHCGVLVDKDRGKAVACHAAARLLLPTAGLDLKNNHLVARYMVTKTFTTKSGQSRCDPLSEQMLAQAMDSSSAHWLPVLGVAQLRENDDNQQDSQLDRDILLRFSNAHLRFGERFKVDVWLASSSKLSRFELRAESRDGSPLVFTRVIPRDPSWSVASEFNSKLATDVQRFNYNLTVRCHIKDEFYHDSVENQRLLFSVEAAILQPESSGSLFELRTPTRAEINWRLSPAVDRGNRSNRRMTSRGGTITLHKLDQGLRGLVPVIKRNHLFNLATVTKKTLYEKLRIFVLNRQYEPMEVTKSATCYITGNRMINVELNCERLFFTGREIQPADAFNVTLLVKYQSEVVRYHLLRVYYPQRVMIHVEDKNLQVISGWHVSRNVSKELLDLSKKRVMIIDGDTDYRSYWQQTNFERSDDANENEDPDCQPTFQQTKLRIFARFSGGCSDLPACWLPEQVNQWFDITPLAVSQLRTSGQGQVHIYSDGRLQGIAGGIVRIQLLTPSGVLLCKESVSVQSSSKVRIESISARLISGMSTSIALDRHGQGSMQIYLRSTLRRRERGFVLTRLNFNDGHSVALGYMNATNYSLRLDSLYSGVQVLPDQQAQVIVNHVTLENLNEDKRLLSLAVSTTSCSAAGAEVVSKVALSWKTFVTARLLPGVSPPSSLSEARFVERQLPADQQRTNGHVADGSSAADFSLLGGNGGARNGFAVVGTAGSSDGVGSQQFGQHKRDRLSSLQIGMYCLLGFLSLALVIFAVNCIVMLTRYRGGASAFIPNHDPMRARLEHEIKSSGAGLIGQGAAEAAPIEEYADMNWVWLNSEQLRQRDSANIAPSHKVKERQPSSAVLNKRYSATESCGLSLVGQPLVRTTYQGQECSIRIVNNPLEASSTVPFLWNSAVQRRCYDDSGEHLYYNHWDTCRATGASEMVPPVPPVRTTSWQLATLAASNDAVSSLHLDRELMQMTSEQLLLYFDNMQETVA